MQSRYYNPEWGRFVNADTESGIMGDLLSSNVFAYCKNNLISMYDPTGKSAVLTGGGLLLVGGIIVGGLLVISGIVCGVNKLIDYAVDSFSSGQVTNASSQSLSQNRPNTQANPQKDTFPTNPGELDKILNVPGKKIKDGPKTPGRNKTKWKVNNDVEITHERHPYDRGAALMHKDYHYHVDAPAKGYNHERFLPGDKLPNILK